MRRLIKTLILAAFLALPLSIGFAVPSMSGGPALHLLSSCEEMDKDYTQLVSLQGEALPMGSGYLAYRDLGDGTAAVYRQTPAEVAALIAEIKAAKAAESGSAQLEEGFWLASSNSPCEWTGKECKGRCKKTGYKCIEKEQITTSGGTAPQPGSQTPRPGDDPDPGDPGESTKDERCICVKMS